MILHKLLAHHLRHGDDAQFYSLQAQDAIRWMEGAGVTFDRDMKILDLGCGHGIFGGEFIRRGCEVVLADEEDFRAQEFKRAQFQQINVEKEEISKLGKFDLVVCSNILEHLADPARFLHAVPESLNPGGMVYLSWTNWLSPWGGHEFSPFHYLGPRWGPAMYDKLSSKPRKHTPFENLFPTYIGKTLSEIRGIRALRIIKMAPRYYPELSLISRLPILRELLAWNTALLIGRTNEK